MDSASSRAREETSNPAAAYKSHASVWEAVSLADGAETRKDRVPEAIKRLT